MWQRQEELETLGPLPLDDILETLTEDQEWRLATPFGPPDNSVTNIPNDEYLLLKFTNMRTGAGYHSLLWESGERNGEPLYTLQQHTSIEVAYNVNEFERMLDSR